MSASQRSLKSAHRARGSMLALVAAAGVVIGALILSACWYMASSSLFTTHVGAIEAAALAAAQDAGRIVVDTPEFGYVALCDEAPIGTNTKAGDNYFTHVKSINELMATARLDAIIADELGDPFVKKLAEIDRDNVIKAKNQLVAEINKCLAPGQSGKDIHGNAVSPYNAALTAYLRNAAPKSKYVEGSLKLSLGSVENGIATAAPLPRPASYANTPSQGQINGFYRSDINIPYGGKDYVFAAVGNEPRLLEAKKFTTSVAGLPFQMPAVVMVSAEQEFGDDKKHKVAYNACAHSGRAIRSPTPGALAYSFPDGPIWELKRPADLRTWGEMGKSCDLLTAQGGDFPVDKPSAIITDTPRPWASPWGGATAPCREVASCAFYDWLRAGGAIANVDAVKDMMNEPWNGPDPVSVMWSARAPGTGNTLIDKDIGLIPGGVQHRFEFLPDGTIDYTSLDITPAPYLVAADSQMYAENPGGGGAAQALKAGPETEEWDLTADLWLPTDLSDPNPLTWNFIEKKGAVIVGTLYFDMYVRDMLRQPGSQKGGKHDGTPMDGKVFISSAPPAQSIRWQSDYGAGGSGAGKSPKKPKKPKKGRQNDGETAKNDQVRTKGPKNAKPNPGGGGIKNVLKGLGLPPMVTTQDDFASTNLQPREYLGYSTGPGSGAPRPTYTTSGIVADIRFRREIDIGDLGAIFGTSTTGYIGEILE